MAYTSSGLTQISLPLTSGVLQASGVVVLLKEESLTKASDSSAIDYSNYGNYKAIKLTDLSGNTQYIISMIGHKNVYDGVRTDYSANDALVKYPVYQHPFELSESSEPLNNFNDGDDLNQEAVFDASLGGSQLRTQNFKYSYESTSYDGNTIAVGRYDLLKGAKVGDSITFKAITGDTVDVNGFGSASTIPSGLLLALNGNKNLFQYLIYEMSFTGSAVSDNRVDQSASAFSFNTPMSATRPGINKITTGVATSASGEKFCEMSYDIQGVGTTSSITTGELGITSTNGLFNGLASVLMFDYTDSLGEEFTESLQISPYSNGFDLSGRVLGGFLSSIPFDNSQFPVTVSMQVYIDHSKEIIIDREHDWHMLTVNERDDSLFPITSSSEVEEDPWCFDRSYTTSCDIQGSGDENPWFAYSFKIENTDATIASPPTYDVKEQSINKRIQWTGSIIKECNIYEQSGLQGEPQLYRYQTKKYYVSTKDRPSMLRTVSLTYRSSSDITLQIRTDKTYKNIIFPKPLLSNEPTTVTKVLGMSAKYFDVRITINQGYPQNFEIQSIQLQYG